MPSSGFPINNITKDHSSATLYTSSGLLSSTIKSSKSKWLSPLGFCEVNIHNDWQVVLLIEGSLKTYLLTLQLRIEIKLRATWAHRNLYIIQFVVLLNQIEKINGLLIVDVEYQQDSVNQFQERFQLSEILISSRR
jgi:hypothetical protein